MAAGAAYAPLSKLCAAVQPPKDYQMANTDWLSECRFGVGVHWTARSAPRHGSALPFQKAVDAFDLKKFMEQFEQTGADYLLFTACHALQMLPAPNPVIDRILPGRTCERDLIGEIADALAARKKHFLVYYNHGCADDKPWAEAIGYNPWDKSRFDRNLLDVVGWMGERYQDKIKAWWFDSAYYLDARGPTHRKVPDWNGYQFPWEEFTVATKKGFPERLVTYNAGVGKTFLYTTHQDYWSGEMNDLNTPAKSRYLDNGLQWFGWTCLDDRWVHKQIDTEILQPLYSDEKVIAYVRQCNANKAPMTFNLGIYQDGSMAEASVKQLRRLNAALNA
jgi:alpha-L-fucosidase